MGTKYANRASLFAFTFTEGEHCFVGHAAVEAKLFYFEA